GRRAGIGGPCQRSGTADALVVGMGEHGGQAAGGDLVAHLASLVGCSSGSSDRNAQPCRSTEVLIVRSTASFAPATSTMNRRVPCSSSVDPGGALSRPTFSQA